MGLTAHEYQRLNAALSTLRSAEQQNLTILRGGSLRIDAAHRPADGEPTPSETRYQEAPEHWRHVRDERIKAAQQAAKQPLVKLADDLDEAAETVERLSEKARYDDGPAEHRERRAERAWPRLQRQLDAGVPPHELIANADKAEVEALRQELPAWQRAHQVRDGRSKGLSVQEVTRPDTDRLHEALDRRQAAVVGGPDGEALTARYDGRELYRQASERVRGTAARFSGTAPDGALRGVVAARLGRPAKEAHVGAHATGQGDAQ